LRKLSFFDNTPREIMIMNYLLAIRRRIIEENRESSTRKKWLKDPGTFIGHAHEIIGGISLDKLLAKINLMSEETCFFR